MRQRQNDGPILLLLIFGLGLALSTNAQVAEGTYEPLYQVTSEKTVPVPKPPLYLSYDLGNVFISMSLDGLAWFNPESDAAPKFDPDLKVLDVTPISENQLLLCGRHSELMIASFEPETGELSVEKQWQTEGIPTQGLVLGQLFCIASCGSGLIVWEMDDPAGEADLIGRYPFAAFVRDADVFGSETLLLSDSQYSGAWMVDISDPMRPRRISHMPVQSFCDSVATDGKAIAYTDRVYGTHYTSASNSEPPRLIRALPSHINPYPKVQNVEMNDRFLLITSRDNGIRLFDRTQKDLVEVLRIPPESEPVYYAIFIDEDTLAIAEEKEIRLIDFAPITNEIQNNQ